MKKNFLKRKRFAKVVLTNKKTLTIFKNVLEKRKILKPFEPFKAIQKQALLTILKVTISAMVDYFSAATVLNC